ncbi:DUF805 domain-containing protein [Vreelandella azerica]
MFDGRAHRKEYWRFLLFNTIIGIMLGLVVTAGIHSNPWADSAVLFAI